MIDDVVITKANLGFLTTASSKKLFAGDWSFRLGFLKLNVSGLLPEAQQTCVKPRYESLLNDTMA